MKTELKKNLDKMKWCLFLFPFESNLRYFSIWSKFFTLKTYTKAYIVWEETLIPGHYVSVLSYWGGLKCKLSNDGTTVFVITNPSRISFYKPDESVENDSHLIKIHSV